MPFLVKIWCFPELCNAFVVVDSAMLRFWGMPEAIEHYILCFPFVKQPLFVIQPMATKTAAKVCAA